MDISSTEPSQLCNQNNNNNNSKIACADDTNSAYNIEFDEQSNDSNELFDIDSSDFEIERSDGEREQSNDALKSVAYDNQISFDEQITGDNNTQTCEFIPKEKNTYNSNEKLTVIGTKQTESEIDFQKPIEKKSEDNDNIVRNHNEDEPIFDFLGKANEIVCYYYLTHFIIACCKYIYLLTNRTHNLTSNIYIMCTIF